MFNIKSSFCINQIRNRELISKSFDRQQLTKRGASPVSIIAIQPSSCGCSG